MATQMAHSYSLDKPWFHGTNSPNFSAWQIPAPPKDEITPPSPAVFFTQDREYAGGAGKNLCTAMLMSSANVLVPASGGAESENLRNKLRSDSEYGFCVHVSSQQLWEEAWKTGDVMRLHFNSTQAPQSLLSAKATLVGAKLRSAGYKSVPQDALMKVTMQYITREWIDRISVSAQQLGHHALIGCEVDRWYGGATQPMPPIARSWMALLDSGAASPPNWI
ncbi:hypothetical protein [Acidovorax sp. Leaf84]|uniref:hypothetical protein n=1 Tax=Acidovorax sp. Leaf84 TaxID=1736240 RepID=UPI000A7B8638|nr:hypothetical protein [Acidovorax sp. Leaf84]